MPESLHSPQHTVQKHSRRSSERHRSGTPTGSGRRTDRTPHVLPSGSFLKVSRPTLTVAKHYSWKMATHLAFPVGHSEHRPRRALPASPAIGPEAITQSESSLGSSAVVQKPE